MPATPCTVPDCERTSYARGHCERHYRQVLRRGALSPARLLGRRCEAEGCERDAVTPGWCHAHYLRWVRTGDVRAEHPLRDPGAPACVVTGCSNRNHARGLCSTHLRRLAVRGTIGVDSPVRSPGRGYVHRSGYRVVPVPAELRHLTHALTTALEHRLVMAILLDRPLEEHEVVHHRNGDRLDNRPASLELWSTAQPKGRRIVDKIEHPREVLRLYAPDELREAGTANTHCD